LYGPDDLGARCAQLGGGEYIVDGLLREQSLGLVVGDSGHGKTPLLYQLAMCVAAGVPFLNRRVKQGRVLYMDYENGLGEVDLMLKRLAKHLNLSSLPTDLLCWNLNDLTPLWMKNGYGFGDLIKDVHPVLTIIDPLGSQFPLAEEKNAAANQTYAALRAIMRTERTSFLNVHHLRKPGEKSGGVHLADGNIHDWFKQARGASSLIKVVICGWALICLEVMVPLATRGGARNGWLRPRSRGYARHSPSASLR
jgi:predicted ATP-dependent serine protease